MVNAARTRAVRDSRKPRRPRGSLSRDDIFGAAVAVLDRHGLSALTMAGVAAQLGVPATSVYWHYRTKDELIDALAEHVTTEVFSKLPHHPHDQPWAQHLLTYFVAYRRAMLEQPAFLSLFASRAHGMFATEAVGQLLTDVLETALSSICRSGVDSTQAMRIYTACSSYTRGFVTLEVAFKSEHGADEADAGARRRQRTLDPENNPIMSRLTDPTAIMNYDDTQFEYGLRSLIAGIVEAITSADGSKR